MEEIISGTLQNELDDFYSSELAQKLSKEFKKIARYCESPENSFRELYDISAIKMKCKSRQRKDVVKNILTGNIEEVFKEYVGRVRNIKNKRQLKFTIVAGDITDVLIENISGLDNRYRGASESSSGKRVYTGQKNRPGSAPGYN